MFLSNCLLVPGPGGRVLGNAARALAGQIVDHPAPGLVVVVELVDGGDPEDHGGQEGQARGEHAEYELPGQRHPDEQSPEDHDEKQEEAGPLRFKHSVLLAGVWRQGWSASPRAGRTSAQHMITTANVRSVTLSSPGALRTTGCEGRPSGLVHQHREYASGRPAERWRWDLNPRRGCPLTRFRGVRPRPLGDSTAGELTRIRACATARPTRRPPAAPRRSHAAGHRTRRRGRRR